MNDSVITDTLLSLSREQLDQLQRKLEIKVAERKAAIKQASKVPPRNQTDLEKLASLQGLDLSGLMREISRR